MIARLIGRLAEVTDGSALLEINGVVYEALVPAYMISRLRERIEGGLRDLTLHTLHFIDGGVGGSAMRPRLIGFLEPSEREFFEVFTTVKGVGTRKALRAMAEEPAAIAGYVEAGDRAALARLPEIGKRTAERMIAELRGKLERFALVGRAAAAEHSFKAEAADVLVNAIQYTRAEAEELIGRALERNGAIDSAEELIQEVFRQQERIQ